MSGYRPSPSSMIASASASRRLSLRVIGRRRVLGRKLGGKRLDRALRVHDFGGADAGEVELHRERLGEQPRIAARNPRAAALAHPDFGDAERLQGAQRVARHDAADAEARGEVLLGAEEIAGLELLREQRIAHIARRSGRRATPNCPPMKSGAGGVDVIAGWTEDIGVVLRIDSKDDIL